MTIHKNDSLETFIQSISSQLLKIFLTVIFSLLLGSYLIHRSEKPKEDFSLFKGKISYLSSVSPLRPEKGKRPKDIFIMLEENPMIFKLFTGMDKADFSPEINCLNELTVGDEINVYFDDGPLRSSDLINKLTQYIYKENELIYQKSGMERHFGYFCYTIAGIVTLIGFYIKLHTE